MLKTFPIIIPSYKKWQDYFLPLVDQGIRQPKSYDNNIICIFYIYILSKNILFVNGLDYSYTRIILQKSIYYNIDEFDKHDIRLVYLNYTSLSI